VVLLFGTLSGGLKFFRLFTLIAYSHSEKTFTYCNFSRYFKKKQLRVFVGESKDKLYGE